MTKRDCILSDITPAQWRDALNLAMANTDYDGLFHKLYQVMDVNWYTGPESARELTVKLFDGLMNIIFGQLDGLSIRDNMTWTASGCIRLELSVYKGNYQCAISFIPHTAEGKGLIYR